MNDNKEMTVLFLSVFISVTLVRFSQLLDRRGLSLVRKIVLEMSGL